VEKKVIKKKVTAKKAIKKGEHLLSRFLPSVSVTSAASVISTAAEAASVVSLLFSCPSAIRASLRFVFKALFLVESLLAFGKSKICVAILASNYLICHIYIPSLINFWIRNPTHSSQ
jgi:hypothetical protein